MEGDHFRSLNPDSRTHPTTYRILEHRIGPTHKGMASLPSGHGAKAVLILESAKLTSGRALITFAPLDVTGLLTSRDSPWCLRYQTLPLGGTGYPTEELFIFKSYYLPPGGEKGNGA